MTLTDLDALELDMQRRSYADVQTIQTEHLRALIAELRTARQDAARLDYLERELELEKRGDLGYSLFRRNVPITRAAIDAAIAKGTL